MIQPRRHRANMAMDLPAFVAAAVAAGAVIGAGIGVAVDVLVHRHRNA